MPERPILCQGCPCLQVCQTTLWNRAGQPASDHADRTSPLSWVWHCRTCGTLHLSLVLPEPDRFCETPVQGCPRDPGVVSGYARAYACVACQREGHPAYRAGTTDQVEAVPHG